MPTARPAEAARTPYSSALRDTHARATRRAIVAAASDLFVEQGYAATTIDAVAARAGVGRKTVFASVGGKGALLKLVWDWAIAGDDEPVPMSERPAVAAMLVEPDPRRLVRMWVDMVVDVGFRVHRIGGVVLAAADVDDDVRTLSDTIRHESLVGATAFVARLAGIGGLRSDVTIDHGAEACWALLNSLLLHLLVRTRGWSPQEYAEWLTRLAAATLLEPADRASPPIATPIRVANDSARGRYEASVDNRVAGELSYQRTERLVVLTRTTIEPDYVNRGVQDALVRAALDDVRADGTRRVVPLCHYVAWFLERHREYAALVYDPTAD